MSEDTGRRLGGHEMGLAEMTGADGAYIFSERILQQIWLRGEFLQTKLRLNDGRSLRILKRGRWNRLAGPDFREAEFRIGDVNGGEILKGDVEVHLRAKDWDAHGHARDPAYDRVVLHVVLFPFVGASTPGGGGRGIPILELLPLLERDLEAYAEEAALENLAGRPFSQLRAALASMPPESLALEVERHARSRWLAKVALARRRIELWGWDETCHRRALEVLGYRPNRDAMLMVAERWPLALWQSGVAQPQEIWSETAGTWINAGVRPANMPRKRLEQYARWIAERPDWPSRLMDVGLGLVKAGRGAKGGDVRLRRRKAGLGALRDRLAFEVTGQVLGGPRFDSMVCDAWLPLLAAREGEQASVSALETCWRDWWAGDTPAELMKLAREYGVGDGANGIVGQGFVQGLLGWLAELLDREGRGT
jgi:hypothetical protein